MLLLPTGRKRTEAEQVAASIYNWVELVHRRVVRAAIDRTFCLLQVASFLQIRRFSNIF